LEEATVNIIPAFYGYRPVLKCAQALELMLVDALLLANDYLRITTHIESPEKFWKVGNAIF
jgi:hypothetical protein